MVIEMNTSRKLAELPMVALRETVTRWVASSLRFSPHPTITFARHHTRGEGQSSPAVPVYPDDRFIRNLNFTMPSH